MRGCTPCFHCSCRGYVRGHHWIFECQVTRPSWHPQPIMLAGCTRAEYQCPVFCLTRTHERLLYTRIRKFLDLAASSTQIRHKASFLCEVWLSGRRSRQKKRTQKKLLKFLYVKHRTRSPAVRWQGSELALLWDFGIISSFVVDALSKKKSIF